MAKNDDANNYHVHAVIAQKGSDIAALSTDVDAALNVNDLLRGFDLVSAVPITGEGGRTAGVLLIGRRGNR